MSGLRWGVMGTGGIAAAMVGALQETQRPVTAVGSQRPGAAEDFAAAWGIPNAVASHDAVAHHDKVDIVYVATTNDRHHANVIQCVSAHKPVLCEKPIAVNARQAGEMGAASKDHGVFLMEAMWMRFLPFLGKVDELVAAGAIGELRHIQAWFSYPATRDAFRRWMNREMGGGSLLDLGVYPLTLAHHLLGPPVDFEVRAELAATGVDASASVLSGHQGEATATVGCSFVHELSNEAILTGTEARIRIAAPFLDGPRVTLERGTDVLAEYDTAYAGHGFQFEVAEAERCVAEGLIESPLRPHTATIEVMEWMDAIRDRIGVVYSADQA